MKKVMIFVICFIVVILFALSLVVIADRYFDADIKDLFDSAKNAENNEKTVVAIVEGKKIYQETIDFLVAGEKISLKNNASVIEESDVEQTVDAVEILNKQIRNAVVLSEAQKLGLSVSDKEAEEYTLKSYNAAKEQGGQVYSFILDYMEELNLTEEEYLLRCKEVNKSKLTRAKLYDNFAEGKTGTYDEIVAEYEKYVEDLVAKADIEYK